MVEFRPCKRPRLHDPSDPHPFVGETLDLEEVEDGCHRARYDPSNGVLPSIRQSYDETQSLSGGDETRICYGMITRMRCQHMRSTRATADDLLKAPANHEYVGLQLLREDDRFTVSLKKNFEFAVLNCKTTLALIALEKLTDVSSHAYISQRDLADASKTLGRRKPQEFEIYANVYGPRGQADLVGETLSKYHTFLQDPLMSEHGYGYHNPHILMFEDMAEDEAYVNDLTADMLCRKQSALRDFATVLDGLANHHTSREIDNSALCTKLLRHQSEAQCFMIDRETGKLDDTMQYWQSDHSDDATRIYRHKVVTDESSEMPDEPRSGILADVMGLGKTLTTISLITASTDRARQHSLKKVSWNQTDNLEVQPSKATLVVVPSLLILEQWESEINRRVRPGTLRVSRYHSHDRARDFRELSKYDIVLTTYGTITTEYRKSRSRKALFHLRWFRIVLDEAHTIRSQDTKQFRAVMALQAEHCWCLTGTPISNKIEDLGALLRFCRVPLLGDRARFREAVAKPLKYSRVRGFEILRRVLEPICIRRSKDLLSLPEPKQVLYEVAFSKVELKHYQRLFKLSRHAIDATVSGHSSKRRQTVLQLILQLRRFCNHGTLLPSPFETTEEHLDPDDALALLQEKEEAFCASCCTEVSMINQPNDQTSGIMGVCRHILCDSCLPELENQGKSYIFCPTCECQVKENEFSNPLPIRKAELRKTEKRSAKLERLLDDLHEHMGLEKSIVFSQWKKTTDVVSELCHDRKIKHVTVDGSTLQVDRRKAIEQFVCDPSMNVLLMTLGTGALGLNLTVATRVHIIEPQWNPTVEEQAIGRVVRLGQERIPTIIRYVVQKSVENSIQGYQRKKVELAAAGFGENSEQSVEQETQLLTATFFQESESKEQSPGSSQVEESSLEDGVQDSMTDPPTAMQEDEAS